MPRFRLAVHKFSSCDGCQLALLNLGDALLELAELVDIVHFAEAGPVNEDAPVDLALVEGSVSTAHDVERIRRIRDSARVLVAIGACATAGGLQSLRNRADGAAWLSGIYDAPQHIDFVAQVAPVSAHVKVDLELWGCPVNKQQVPAALKDVMLGVAPRRPTASLCLECKRLGRVCTLVTGSDVCMGPVTRAGCGALCQGRGRGCYACFGPAEGVNTEALGRRLHAGGLTTDDVARRFHFINANAPAFAAAGDAWRRRDGGDGT